MGKLTVPFIGFLCLIGLSTDARPQGNGYRTNCKPRLVRPGVWDFSCDPPADDKITLNLEHIVQFKNSDLTDDIGTKEINVAVPNYKIRQVIRPQIVDEEGVNATSLKVNIHLLTPEIQTDRQEAIQPGLRGTPKPPPEVHIKYPQVGEAEENFRDPKFLKAVVQPVDLDGGYDKENEKTL